MTENKNTAPAAAPAPAAATAATAPAPAPKAKDTAPTEAELKAMFDALPGVMQTSITALNANIDKHGKSVDSLKAAGAKDAKLIKAEIFEQNPDNNKKLAAFRKEYDKLQEQIEAVVAKAYAVIDEDGLMPKELSEAEIEKLKGEVSESAKTLKSQVAALAEMEKMMGLQIVPLLHEIKTQRGTAKTGTTSGRTGDGPKRLRFKRIEVNGQVEDDKGNKVYGLKDNEPKFTFTFASNYLKKHHKGIDWVANDLTEAYLKGLDENNLPEVHEFVMPYTFKDVNGNEHTVNYTIKAYRG